jgi:hypothetical protein
LTGLGKCGVKNVGGEHEGACEPHEIPKEMKKIIEYFFSKF